MISLDHGILNIPGRTKNIDRELDAYKAKQAKDASAARMAAAAQNRADKAKAKAMLGEHGAALIAAYGAKFGAKAIAAKFDQLVKWEPRKFIAIAESFVREKATGAQS